MPNVKNSQQEILLSQYKGMKLLLENMDGVLLSATLKHFYFYRFDSADKMQCCKAAISVYKKRFGNCPYSI